MHGGDVQIRQRRVRVLAGDGGIVPLGDRAVEDLRDGGRVEVQRVDAVDVEDDRDGRDVGGELDERVGGAAVEGAGGDLVGLEGTIAAREGGGALLEGLAARAGAGGVIVHGDVGVRGLEAGDPGLLGRALRRGAAAHKGAGERRGLGIALGRCALVRGARGEGERGDAADGGDLCEC